MKRAIACLAASLLPLASPAGPPAERPNLPVYRSGPWFVVRSVREGGDVVACTGFYRANRNVQLGRDMLVIKAPAVEVEGVAFAFDGESMPARRPPSAGEKDIPGVAFTGADFARLARAQKVRIELGTPQGTMQHDLELAGLAGALDNINAGCPVPAEKAPAATHARRRRHHG